MSEKEKEGESYDLGLLWGTLRKATSDFNPQDEATGRQWTWMDGDKTVIRTQARTGPGCHDNCGVLLYVKDGKVVDIEGDPENPYNMGRLCCRCLDFEEMVYHKDRLQYPMKRAVEDRGKNTWERITWDEAYDLIEENFKRIQAKYGQETLWCAKGTGRDTNGYMHRFAESAGTPNNSLAFLSGHSCYQPRIASTGLTFGDFFVADFSQFFPDRWDNPQFKNPECVVIWGNNPIVANSDGTLGWWIVECMKRGTELIVVDPKVTWLAAHAKYHLQIRPGTDGALALAMANIMITEDIYDHDFVENWCYGFEEYAQHVSEWTAERAASVCGIDAEDILGAARFYAGADGASLQWGVAIDHAKDGFAIGMAVMALIPLTGNIENPGGNVVARACWGINQTWMGSRPAYGPKVLSDEQADKRMNDDYPLMQAMGGCSPDMAVKAMETGEPYPIRALWLQQANPLTCTGNDPQRLYKAFLKSEFTVVVDMFMTPTALAVADVVLPACSFAERAGLSGHQPYYLGAIVKAIEPVGESRSDQVIINDMAKRFAPEQNPWKDDIEIYDEILAKASLDYETMKERTWAYPPFQYYRYKTGDLRPDGKPGFQTASGKYEFKCDSFEYFGLPIMPTYTEPVQSPVSDPELAKEYPLVLTTGARKWALFHSEHRQAARLRRINEFPEVTIHPETAAQFGIENGDWTIVEGTNGSCRLKAVLDPRIRRDTVSADHAWWFPERGADDGTFFGTFESNINCLLPFEPGPTGYGTADKSLLCKIYKEA